MLSLADLLLRSETCQKIHKFSWLHSVWKAFEMFPYSNDTTAHKFMPAFLLYDPAERADVFFFRNNGVVALQATSSGNQRHVLCSATRIPLACH